MTTAPSALPRERLAESLVQALDALGALAGVIGDLGEQATASTEIRVLVHSEAEVDAAAAILGAVPSRLAGQYRFLKRTGTVTVTVALCALCAACSQDAPGSAS